MLRVLRGEDLELVSRNLGVTAAALSGWRDAFLAAGSASLKSRSEDDRDRQIKALHAKVGEITMANELPEAKIERLEGGRLFGCGGRDDEPDRLRLRAAPLRPGSGVQALAPEPGDGCSKSLGRHLISPKVWQRFSKGAQHGFTDD
ncbi:MAG: hypothetical protein ACOCXK_00065 [Rhodosalinus sp.]